MEKNEARIAVLIGIFLLIMFILSSTNLIISDDVSTLRPISIVIADTYDDNYLNFKKGVEKAATIYNANVNMITLYKKGDAKEQMALVSREISDGTRSIVLDPVKAIECGKIADNMILNTSFVVLGSMYMNNSRMSRICINYDEMTNIIMKNILFDADNNKIAIISQGEEFRDNNEILYRLNDSLGENIKNVSEYHKISKEQLKNILSNDIILSLDIDSMDRLLEIIGDTKLDKNKLYCIGYNDRILAALDDGRIKGAVIDDEYLRGYLSVKKAIKALETGSYGDDIILNSYYINKYNKKGKMDKMLYPIE